MPRSTYYKKKRDEFIEAIDFFLKRLEEASEKNRNERRAKNPNVENVSQQQSDKEKK